MKIEACSLAIPPGVESMEVDIQEEASHGSAAA